MVNECIVSENNLHLITINRICNLFLYILYKYILTCFSSLYLLEVVHFILTNFKILMFHDLFLIMCKTVCLSKLRFIYLLNFGLTERFNCKVIAG